MWTASLCPTITGTLTQVADTASGLFQELLDGDAKDREALVGRAEAEFLLGNYITARSHFIWAREIQADEAAAERIDLCNRIIELDPTRRAISTRERFRRSRVLVERTAVFVNYCRNPQGADFAGPLPGVPEDLAGPLGRAIDLLESKARQRANDENIEANILLAEETWNARQGVCAEIEHDDEPLRLLLAKLSR